MMALNRYRLRHLVAKKHRGALRANALLKRPDRLIGLILLGNNFVNILASSIATILALRLIGEAGVAIAAGLMTLVILIFAEVAPKTVAALDPERVAFPAAFVLKPLLRLLYPLVWIVNTIANGVLRIFRIRPEDSSEMTLSREELRSVVKEAGAMIPRRHQQMLFGILDLEKVTVEDIMVPRNEIVGIDLEDDPADLETQLSNCRHTRLPVFRGSFDNVIGMLHVRKVPRLYDENDEFDPTFLESVVSEPYYVPIGTPLHTQLTNFQRQKRRIGLVVDEYGNIQGLVTLEDILEEIVGEFTTDPQEFSKDIHPQDDGTYLIDGTATIREINRSLKWKLPASGPKTLNGLILETFETIPDVGTSMRIDDYTVEIVHIAGQSVKTARITPTGKRTHPEAQPMEDR
jgi:Mg2+/Co2+ transporter CorB